MGIGRFRPHTWRVGNHGYLVLFDRSHPCADRHGYVLQHVAVVTLALGHPLPAGAQVHHVNEIKTDNRGLNLVACQDRAYHMLLHQRQAALEACGHADWRQCAYCSEYDAPTALIRHGSRSVVHRACVNEYQRQRYARRTAARKA